MGAERCADERCWGLEYGFKYGFKIGRHRRMGTDIAKALPDAARVADYAPRDPRPWLRACLHVGCPIERCLVDP